MMTEEEKTIQSVNRYCRKKVLEKFDDIPCINGNVISTGISTLDEALGIGGICKGSIVEISGTEGSGKTTIALQIAKQFQNQGKSVLYIDSERTIKKEVLERAEVNCDGFYIMRSNSMEEVFTACMYGSKVFGAIIIDSFSALLPECEMNAEVHFSGTSKVDNITSDLFPALLSSLDESGCVLIVVNQLREKFGILFGNPETTTGGRALKYYASVRMDVRVVEHLRKLNKPLGFISKIKINKNNFSVPFKETEYEVMYV